MRAPAELVVEGYRKGVQEHPFLPGFLREYLVRREIAIGPVTNNRQAPLGALDAQLVAPARPRLQPQE
jgi:hypothetical protein